MDDSNPGMLIVWGIILFMVFIFAMAANSNRQKELRAFAQQFNGRVQDAGLFGGSFVDLDFGGVTARLDYTSSDDSSFTNLTVPLRLPIGRLKLQPQHWGHQIGKFLGMEDIEIGVPEFDDAFIIQGSDPKGIAQLLTPTVRGAITDLRRISSGGLSEVHLGIGAGSLRVTIGGHLSSHTSLANFVMRCRALYDLLNPDSSQGIEFISPGPTAAPKPLPAEAECQICGSALKENIVYCAKCKTPHHRDCWQYFGSCSVYGCGEKRFSHPATNSNSTPRARQ